MAGQFEGRVALVTGGSSGIGRNAGTPPIPSTIEHQPPAGKSGPVAKHLMLSDVVRSQSKLKLCRDLDGILGL